MKNYIVTIYRNEGNESKSVVGVVEDVGEEVKRAFKSFEELRDILSAAGLARAELTNRSNGMIREER